MVNSATCGQAQSNLTFSALKFGSCTFVFGYTQVILRMWLCSGPVFKLLSFKLHHFTGMWVWYSSWVDYRQDSLELISITF